MTFLRAAVIFAFLTILACNPAKKATVSGYGKKDGKVEWIFLQLNDVYEITPIENGKSGGLARVATLRQRLIAENPNTFTVLAGDFLSPSVIGTLRYEGKSIKGAQMIDVLNALGLDFVCFGNHEFDLDYLDLQKRIDESKFQWISANAFRQNGEGIEPFSRSSNPQATAFPEYKIIDVTDGEANESVRLGLWSVVLDANKKDYIYYSDYMERSHSIIEEELKKKSDVIVGLTHVTIDSDKEIAANNPSVALIMGGHEHNNMIHRVGKTVVTKADANAKTAWVHRFSYDLKSQKTTLKSELVPINDQITDEPTTAAVVKKWTDIADKSFAANGFDPDDVVIQTSEIFDGREATNRLQQTNLGLTIATSMAVAAKQKVDCAFFNSGSVRIDDQVTGTITQLDIVRILPFGGKIVELDIKGSELRKVLTAGLLSRGRGGYLQWYQIAYNDATKTLTINGLPLDDSKIYHVATNDFLLSGKETNLEFFTENNPNLSNISKPNANDANDVRGDLRKALIQYLKNRK